MLKKNTFLSSALFAAVFIFTLIFPGLVFAQAEGIKISPVRIEDLADPGQTLQKTIKVTNDSDSAKTLYPYIKDFKADGEEGAAKLMAPGTGDESSLAAWINTEMGGTYFEPHEEKEIPLTIAIPANIGPGGYYGAIVFGTQAPKVQGTGEEKGAAIAISQQTGALILLQVAGDVKEEANIREFSTDKEFYTTPFEVKFLARIENTGNVHLKPNGTIEIQNIFGKTTNILRINEKGVNVLPKSIRKFQSSWSGDFAFGRYKAIIALAYGTPVTERGHGMQSMIQEKYFWVFPWKIIIPAILGITFIGALIVLFLKYYKSRAVKKAMEEMGLTKVRYVQKIEGPSPTLHLGLITAAILVALFLIAGAAYFIIFA